MVDPINDITRQARQGSVAAIIQVLNDKLANAGVRTRAMFDQGILQILCEAAKPEQLEQTVLVPEVRQILESLQPRSVRRVNINSRIVREQQLLWLEEINRDPDNQLLWSEEITLAKPSLIQRFAQERQAIKPSSNLISPASPRIRREKKLFWRGLVGGASLSLFLLLLGGALYHWLKPASQSANQSTSQPASPLASASPAAVKADPFAEAVRLAEQTVGAGQSAQTTSEWLNVASRWQRASDLMGQIPATDPRYPTAQDRVQRYRQNSEEAQRKAQAQQ
ncbi:MAG: hypothetical protein KME07_12545 [Pegethrix bostrychoides GSE-TBD4-15B]|jgi:hypothetical protein|uniref:Uncharacterized protein n=1 Tax=Pegethrix bostrychoides GSE-TBD4-15B TaxID=2839662 RepID=A0A951PB55_9CYAN|nr:hypothetical protein [Pegethrix bostrychoides GSE-TBD4-15B]